MPTQDHVRCVKQEIKFKMQYRYKIKSLPHNVNFDKQIDTKDPLFEILNKFTKNSW